MIKKKKKSPVVWARGMVLTESQAESLSLVGFLWRAGSAGVGLVVTSESSTEDSVHAALLASSRSEFLCGNLCSAAPVSC